MDIDNCKAEDHISLDVKRRVNKICESFESAFRLGNPRSIEQLVQSWMGEDRNYLLLELILLDHELRNVAGESVGFDEYIRRFPDDKILIHTLIDSNDSQKTPQWPSKSESRGDPDSVALPRMGADYDILEEIGRGGQGVVYKAYQHSLKRVVALKSLAKGRLASHEERERFRLEAERAANLVHRNIVPIYAVGEFDGYVFFTMELVDGGNLADIKNELITNPSRAAHLVSSIAKAIHFAHGKGFIHCDLKPANILLNQEGKPCVTDFGLSRAVLIDDNLTANEIFGTPSYMAPEQAGGRLADITQTTDVYGLGAILYDLLTGQPPFRGATKMDTVMLVLESEPSAPRTLNPQIPPALERICLKCLVKALSNRYETSLDVHEALESYLRGDELEGDSLLQRLRRATRRQPELVLRLGGLMLLFMLTEYNHHYSSPSRNSGNHYFVQAIFLLWAMISMTSQYLLSLGYSAQAVRVAWSACDVLTMTSIIYLLDGFGSELLVGYPIAIVVSGLTFNVRLIWLTTALALFGYLSLATKIAITNPYGFSFRYVNIFAFSLAFTGFVVVRNIKRTLLLSEYYRHRHDG